MHYLLYARLDHSNNITKSKIPKVLGVSLPLIILALVLFCIRIHSRTRHSARKLVLAWDDITLSLAVVSQVSPYSGFPITEKAFSLALVRLLISISAKLNS